MRRIRDCVVEGEIGTVYAVDLVFHNAYGPDKALGPRHALAGGGCVIDLGIHLVDLALWVLGAPRVTQVRSRLFAQGQRAAAGGRRGRGLRRWPSSTSRPAPRCGSPARGNSPPAATR